jgi:hypothetical protein
MRSNRLSLYLGGLTMFYSAHNRYASETRIGFANTWVIWCWETRKARDAYLAQCRDLASRPIRKKEIGQYLYAPRPFSGEAFRLNPSQTWCDDMPSGFVGEVDVSTEGWSRIF